MIPLSTVKCTRQQSFLELEDVGVSCTEADLNDRFVLLILAVVLQFEALKDNKKSTNIFNKDALGK